MIFMLALREAEIEKGEKIWSYPVEQHVPPVELIAILSWKNLLVRSGNKLTLRVPIYLILDQEKIEERLGTIIRDVIF